MYCRRTHKQITEPRIFAWSASDASQRVRSLCSGMRNLGMRNLDKEGVP